MGLPFSATKDNLDNLYKKADKDIDPKLDLAWEKNSDSISFEDFAYETFFPQTAISIIIFVQPFEKNL